MLVVDFQNRNSVSLRSLVIATILLSTNVLAVEDFNGNCLGPESEARENAASKCSLSASLKSNLDAADAVISTLQELVINAKSKIHDLESKACKLPELKHSSPPANCYEIKQRNCSSSSEIYKVWPRYLNRPISVYCDMTTDNGGWTVFQRRDEYEGRQEDFFLNWLDYKEGFGNLANEFWLGNDAISALSNEEENILRIDLEDFEGNKRYALYNTFSVSPETTKYQLRVSGYEGDAGDSMKIHTGHVFSTKDTFVGPTNCTQLYKGGWWYAECHHANLNGLYLRGNHSSYADGIEWKAWLGFNYSLKKTEMKMRPK